MTGCGWVWSLLLSQYVGYLQTRRVDIKGNATGIKEAAAAWIIDQRFVSAVAQNLKKVHNLVKNMLGGPQNGSVTLGLSCVVLLILPKYFILLCHIQKYQQICIFLIPAVFYRYSCLGWSEVTSLCRVTDRLRQSRKHISEKTLKSCWGFTVGPYGAELNDPWISSWVMHLFTRATVMRWGETAGRTQRVIKM